MSVRNTAVIFDLDGTLVDTLGDIAAAMNHVLESSGMPSHAVERYPEFIGHGARHLVEHALPETARHKVQDFLDAFRQRYMSHLTERSAPYPGIVPLLNTLRLEEYPISVLSNKPDHPTKQLVSALFDTSIFHSVQGHREDTALKPDPASALALHAVMGAERCVFVGDSEVDMQTAHAAQMRGIGVAWGLRSVDALRAAGADAILEQPADLLQHL